MTQLTVTIQKRAAGVSAVGKKFEKLTTDKGTIFVWDTKLHGQLQLDKTYNIEAEGDEFVVCKEILSEGRATAPPTPRSQAYTPASRQEINRRHALEQACSLLHGCVSPNDIEIVDVKLQMTADRFYAWLNLPFIGQDDETK